MVWRILLLLVIAVLGVTIAIALLYKKESYYYKPTDDVFYNPLMGFAVNADYYDAVENNTLVYMDINWRDWEPEEGKYAVDAVISHNFLEDWKKAGKNVVLRFVCDVPSDEYHMDIPDWLYEKTGDGVMYDHSYGKGYAPDYENLVFMEAHEKAIEALGETFGQDSFIAYVQLGSLGHWGEWHMLYTEGTTRIPKEEIRLKYVLPYIDAFPNAKILARRPFPETAKYRMGLYNDMAGEPSQTTRWLEWIAEGGEYKQPLVPEMLVSQENVWETAPIGGEFTSSLTYDDMLNENLDRTLSLFQQSHTTFIGPKCPVKDDVEQYQEGVDEVLRTIGYRYGIRKCTIRYHKWKKTGSIQLTIENRGLAPIYFHWHMYLYVYDEHGELMERLQVSLELTQLYGGSSGKVTMKGIPMKDNYTYGIAIENPDTGEPAVWLDMDCRREGQIYYLK